MTSIITKIQMVNRSPRREIAAFTLLEVVIAMSMLALIAVPAVGLAIVASQKSQLSLTAGYVTELKSRIEAVLAAAESVDGLEGAVYFASKDLLYIEPEGGVSAENDMYFKVSLSLSDEHIPSEAALYRFYICHVEWPTDGSRSATQYDAIYPIVIRR